ncbi:hypothetical protein RBI22_21860 [Alcaligenaceae bacterium C4P045]|nr:hypothetical protein [Alcaligenaceae bacterium C4P045]
MKRNFRHDARAALARAKHEMESADFARLRYATLELRLSIEALTYDRAQAFSAEIPPTDYGTWQPKKLLQVLLDIDPHVDQASTLRFGEEEITGQPAGEMHSLGTETVFDLRALKKHYDALGSFLHMPTLKQIEGNANIDFSKLRSRCEHIVVDLEAALGSPVFNITLGSFAQIECVECGKPVRKRFPSGPEAVEAHCFACPASYRLTLVGAGRVHWQSLQQDIVCPTDSCLHVFAIWSREIKQGAYWTCPKCQMRYVIGYAFQRDPAARNENLPESPQAS